MKRTDVVCCVELQVVYHDLSRYGCRGNGEGIGEIKYGYGRIGQPKLAAVVSAARDGSASIAVEKGRKFLVLTKSVTMAKTRAKSWRWR